MPKVSEIARVSLTKRDGDAHHARGRAHRWRTMAGHRRLGSARARGWSGGTRLQCDKELMAIVLGRFFRAVDRHAAGLQ